MEVPASTWFTVYILGIVVLLSQSAAASKCTGSWATQACAGGNGKRSSIGAEKGGGQVMGSMAASEGAESEDTGWDQAMESMAASEGTEDLQKEIDDNYVLTRRFSDLVDLDDNSSLGRLRMQQWLKEMLRQHQR